jgi:hypothetical protein
MHIWLGVGFYFYMRRGSQGKLVFICMWVHRHGTISCIRFTSFTIEIEPPMELTLSLLPPQVASPVHARIQLTHTSLFPASSCCQLLVPAPPSGDLWYIAAPAQGPTPVAAEGPGWVRPHGGSDCSKEGLTDRRASQQPMPPRPGAS